MDKGQMFCLVRDLEFNTKKIVYEEGGVKVGLLRPSKVSKRFKDYNVRKNFQIWLFEENREFRPNHLRVMIDLHLRARSRPDKVNDLLLAFDNIFCGTDPVDALRDLAREHFEHFLNPLCIIGQLCQLFIIEQEYCYHKESKFDPPTLFFQGWIRQAIYGSKEIDNLCMSVCSRQPPLRKYVCAENRKDKKYDGKVRDLWYL
ncbi:MAG: hypothetical protein ABII89_03040 [Candidatus Omnitrophota bacterium]